MKNGKSRRQNVIRYVVLLLGGAVSVLPMIYMLSTSLRPNGALYEFPPHFFPKLSEITLENYRYIFAQEKFCHDRPRGDHCLRAGILSRPV